MILHECQKIGPAQNILEPVKGQGICNTQWISLVTFKSDALWDSLANVCSNSTICKFLFSFAWVSWCKFSSSLANSSNFSWCCLQSEEGRKFPCWYRKAEERVVTNKNHLELNLSGEYFDLLSPVAISELLCLKNA